MTDHDAEGSTGASDFTVHRRGTFPAGGSRVAFSAHDSTKLTGKVEAKLSWDSGNSPNDIIIHLSAFLVDASGQVVVGNPYYCVNHDNDRSKDGSTVRRGRRKHGDNTDEETVTTTLVLVDADVKKVVFVAYIQDAEPLNHSFEVMHKATVVFTHIPDRDRGDGVVKIEEHLLDRDYNLSKTAVILGELYRRGEETEKGWSYRNIGEGRSSLVEVGHSYGVVFVTDEE